ncbi:hypothetical protein HK102_003251, partial [Quaeritorhiza haematococci]
MLWTNNMFRTRNLVLLSCAVALASFALQLTLLSIAHPLPSGSADTHTTPGPHQTFFNGSHRLLTRTRRSIEATDAVDAADPGRSIELRANGVLINGKYTILRGGSLQWFRIPPEEWEDRLLKFKAMGYNFVDMYVAWRNHEVEPGRFDWKTYDIERFLELTKKYGLYVYLRPGPYITNEMDGGGYPYWVRALADKRKYDPLTPDGTMNLRTNDKDFMDAVDRYFSALNKKILPYLYTKGGPIILYAVENEFDWGVASFDSDKWADLADGKPERPVEQKLDHFAYVGGLRDIVRKTGVDIPITVCPGDGKLGGTFEVPSLHPFPNIYYSLHTAEYAVRELRSLLRARPHYASTPIGVTETNRDNWVLKRLLLGGADVITQFNIFAYHQEGRQNGMALNVPSFYGFSQLELFLKGLDNTLHFDDFSFQNPQGAIRIPMGMFPGAIDKNAAVTASGLLRDKFFALRRTNMFIEAFEDLIAPADAPKRTSTTVLPVEDSDQRVRVKNRDVGSSDPDALTGKVNYWLPLGENNNDGSKGVILGLLNFEGTQDIVLNEQDVEAFGTSFPVYSKLTVPFEYAEAITEGPALERRYTMFVPINIPIGGSGFRVDYATSEILTFRKWGKKTVLVLYNKDGTQGEIKVSGPAGYTVKAPSVKGMTERPVVVGKGATTTASTTATATAGAGAERTKESGDASAFIFTYTHVENDIQTVTLSNGDQEFQIVILDSQAAGRTWILTHKTGFFRIESSEVLLINIDYLQPDTSIIQQLPSNNDFLTISPHEIQLSSSVTAVKEQFDSNTGITRFTLARRADPPTISIPLDQSPAGAAFLRNDVDEAAPEYHPKLAPSTAKVVKDTTPDSWLILGDRPDYIEPRGISGGHVWYRAEVDLTPEDFDKIESLRFFGESAGDFVSIYVNGNYALTVLPLGNEINSAATYDKHSGFKIPKSFWKVGKNVLAFKLEIWGAGSFMFPKGAISKVKLGSLRIPLPGIKISLPGFSCDSVKGLAGTFTVGTKPVTNWVMRAGLGGELAHFESIKISWGEGGWEKVTPGETFPLQLPSGGSVWFYTSIDPSSLPDPTTWFSPAAIRLRGTNTRATIYINNRIIGRWLSDDDFLKRGNWAAPVRNLWTWVTSVDEFPVARHMLRDGKNEVAILFEDSGDGIAGEVAVVESAEVAVASEVLTAVEGGKELQTRQYERIHL